MTNAEYKSAAEEALKVSDEFVLVTWDGEQLHVNNKIGPRSLTMLGGLELAKSQIMDVVRPNTSEALKWER